MAFLVPELNKRDPMLRTPLFSYTYPKHIPILVGGGMVEFTDTLYVDEGVFGGVNGNVVAPGSTTARMPNVNLTKEAFKAIRYTLATFLKWDDVQAGQISGHSLDSMYTDCVKRNYQNFCDTSAYIGLASAGNTGLLNDPKVTAYGPGGTSATGFTGNWMNGTTTPLQILDDVLLALSTTFDAAGNDPEAYPDQIILPYKQFQFLANPVTSAGSVSILTYLKQNYPGVEYGKTLNIGATKYTNGTWFNGGLNRMVVYPKAERFVAMDEFLPLTRVMTNPVAEYGAGYVSVFKANIGPVKINYYNAVSYWEGI